MIKTSCPNYVMIYCLAKFYSFISPITNQNVKCFVQFILFTYYVRVIMMKIKQDRTLSKKMCTCTRKLGYFEKKKKRSFFDKEEYS